MSTPPTIRCTVMARVGTDRAALVVRLPDGAGPAWAPGTQVLLTLLLPDVDQSGSVSRVDPSGLAGGGDPSGAVAELPDAAIEAGPVSVGAVRDAAAAMVRWCDDPTASPTVLGSILVPLVPAVRAEAVVEHDEATQELATLLAAAAGAVPVATRRLTDAIAAALCAQEEAADENAGTWRGWSTDDVAELLAGAIGSVPVATPPGFDPRCPFDLDGARCSLFRGHRDNCATSFGPSEVGRRYDGAWFEWVAEDQGPVATPTPLCSQRASHSQLVQPCPECGFRPDWLRAATPAPALPFPGTDEVAAHVALSDETVVEEEATPPTCGHGIDRAHDLPPTPWERSRCPGPIATPTRCESQHPRYGRCQFLAGHTVDHVTDQGADGDDDPGYSWPVATPTEPAPGSDEAYRLQQHLQAENRLVATLHGRSDPCTCPDCEASRHG